MYASHIKHVDHILRAIRDERFRQVDGERWSCEHDDRHTEGELADAAAFYAATSSPEGLWPWPDDDDDDPSGERRKARKCRARQLIIAAALIVAELERLQRADGFDVDRDAFPLHMTPMIEKPSAQPFTRVYYAQLVSGPNFSNRTIGAMRKVEPGEDADAALRKTQDFVMQALRESSPEELRKDRDDIADGLRALAEQISSTPDIPF